MERALRVLLPVPNAWSIIVRTIDIRGRNFFSDSERFEEKLNTVSDTSASSRHLAFLNNLTRVFKALQKKRKVTQTIFVQLRKI